MSGEISAGLLVYRQTSDGPEFLLVHPGGPFWKNKDEAAWSIPKGLVDPGEDLWAAALREFTEETGLPIAAAGVELTACRTPGGKIIHAWLIEADLDVTAFHSNSFEMEWPPKSGKRGEFPEVDRAAYFDTQSALTKIHKGQRSILIDALERLGQAGVTASRQ
jgi:predicted NUDIX family NTP pyrophosphohydrolase